MKKKIDKKDVDIMWELYRNSRVSNSKIAKKIRVPKETVAYRIDQLEKAGIINKYHIVTNSTVFNLDFYQLYIKTHGIPSNAHEKIVREIKKIKNLCWFVKTSGKYSFVIAFLAKTHSEYMKSYLKVREILGKYIVDFSVNLPVTGKLLDYPFFKEYGRSEIRTATIPKKNKELDMMNKKILELLSENCRIPTKEIADQLKVNEKTIKNRIRWLENHKYIISYSVQLHPGEIGYFFHLGLIKLNKFDQKIIDYLETIPEMFYILAGAGFFELQIETYCETPDRIYEIEQDLYEKFGKEISEIDILPIIKEYIIKYFVNDEDDESTISEIV